MVKCWTRNCKPMKYLKNRSPPPAPAFPSSPLNRLEKSPRCVFRWTVLCTTTPSAAGSLSGFDVAYLPTYARSMIHRESFKATSISLPSDLMERLKELSAEVGEPIATIQRQVIRAAFKRGWTFDVLDPPTETDERSVVRLSLSPRLIDQTLRLRGAAPLSTWYRAALQKFLALHDAGDRTIWNLKG